MFAFSTLLWPMTPDLFLAKWWWTIILSRQAGTSRGAAPAVAALGPLVATVPAPAPDTVAGRKAKAA